MNEVGVEFFEDRGSTPLASTISKTLGDIMNKMKLLIVLIVVICVSIALGENEDKFSSEVSVGSVITSGNSEAMQFNALLATKINISDSSDFRSGVELNYGKATIKKVDDDGTEKYSEKTIDNFKIFSDAKKEICRRAFGAINTSFFVDNIAEIDYRVSSSFSLGIYLLKNETTVLSADVGPAYVWEKVEKSSKDFFAVRFGQDFTLVLTDSSKLWQSFEYYPKAEKFSDFLMNVEVGAKSSISKNFDLRFVFQNAHDSSRKFEAKKNDRSIICSVSLNF